MDVSNENNTDPIAALTPEALREQPMVIGASMPLWMLDRACGAVGELVRTLDRIASEGSDALTSVAEAQQLARAAVSESVRELMPALEQARSEAVAVVATGPAV